MKIAVLGGGNGSFAAAGDLALAGHEVRMWRRDVRAATAHHDAGDAVRIGAPSMAGEASRRWRARLERLAMSPSQFAGEYPVALNADVRPILGTIRVPTLVLHRTGNRYIRVGNGRYLAEHFLRQITRAYFFEAAGQNQSPIN